MQAKVAETLELERTAVQPSGVGRRLLKQAERPPVDREHLDRTTFGDVRLQTEVLRLFLKQMSDQSALLRGTDDLDVRREAAHTLVGAAKGIGAFKVAAIAGEIERAKGPIIARMKALDAATAAARDFIADILRD